MKTISNEIVTQFSRFSAKHTVAMVRQGVMWLDVALLTAGGLLIVGLSVWVAVLRRERNRLKDVISYIAHHPDDGPDHPRPRRKTRPPWISVVRDHDAELMTGVGAVGAITVLGAILLWPAEAYEPPNNPPAAAPTAIATPTTATPTPSQVLTPTPTGETLPAVGPDELPPPRGTDPPRSRSDEVAEAASPPVPNAPESKPQPNPEPTPDDDTAEPKSPEPTPTDKPPPPQHPDDEPPEPEEPPNEPTPDVRDDCLITVEQDLLPADVDELACRGLLGTVSSS